MCETATKKCTKCGEVKPLEEFYLDKNHKTGRSSACKVCVKAYRQSPEYKAYMKAYNQTPEYKAYMKAYNQTPERKAYLQSPEYKARHKAYNQTPERKACVKAYNQTPERKAHRARIARKHSAQLTDRYVKTLLREQLRGTCSKIPQEVVELKRKQLQIHRIVNGETK